MNSSRATCRRLLGRWVYPSTADAERVVMRAHAAECPDCADAIRAFEAARTALGAHHAGLEPDGAFRARVAARVAAESAPPTALVWAARRLLPLATALALVLSGWSATLERPALLEALVFGSLGDDTLAALVVSDPGRTIEPVRQPSSGRSAL